MARPEIPMTPGPTAVPPDVFLAQGSPLVYHRGPAYGELLREVTAGLKALLETDNDIVVFTSSGTGGLESAVANLFSPGDRVVVPVAGYFGERLAKIADAFGLNVRRIDYEWGRAVEPEDVQAALEEAATAGVLFQHSETSTGVVHDIEPIARAAERAGALSVVDVISSAGAVPLRTDAWGIDVAVGGSQKALSATPGIAFCSVSERAWAATTKAKNPRFYFDWAAYKRSFEKPNPEAPWTPAISLMLGMREALRLYLEEGPENVLKRHELLSRGAKEGVQALGLDLFGDRPGHAWAVTTVKVPEGIDGKELVAKVRRDHGIILAGGQGPLEGKVFRIGHLGYYDKFDIIRALAALELTLLDLEYPVKLGSGVAAAEEVFAQG